MAAMSGHICIPVMESSEVVMVDINKLPEEPEDLLEILAAEAAPLSTWYDFARAYLAQGKEAAFVHICQEGTREEVIVEVERFFGKKPVYELVQFYCALAALHLTKAKDEKDRAKRADLLNIATKMLTNAKLLDPNEQLVHIGQGQLLLAKNELAQAKQEFSRAIQLQNNGRQNIAAILALAGLMYNNKQLKEALALYRRALREHPGCPPEVRLGIAACSFRLGNMALAQSAYERVLALDPDCADAHLGLAAIKFNSSNQQQGMADGLAYLARAFELDPTNVATLNMLAHYCLLQGQYEKVLVLAKSALEGAENDTLRADSYVQLARAYHALGSQQEATQSYASASRLDPNLALPHLGLAQMYLARGLDDSSVINASSELETALKFAPAFYDALKILGQLIADNPTKVEKTIGHFRDAAAKREEDPGIWELLAELLAPTDPAGSLKAYEHALGIHRRKQREVVKRREEALSRHRARVAAKKAAKVDEDDLFGSDDEGGEEGGASAKDQAAAEAEVLAAYPTEHRIPSQLLNNAAVLFYRAGRTAQGIGLMNEANASAKKEAEAAAESGSAAEITASDLQRVTLGYNNARLQEASGHYLQARSVYEAILQQHPGYIDCYLRLACISHRTGAVDEALRWAQRALDLQGGHADALALMSQLYMEKRDYHQANVMIKRLLEERAHTKDSYGRLAYANLQLALAPSDRRREGEAKKAEEKMHKAYDNFVKVLHSEPGNVYAANGLGAVLAELGRLDEAKEVFTEVQAAVAAAGGFLQIPDLYINLANVALAKQEYTSAVRLYQVALEKTDMGKRSMVLLYLARAHYDGDDLRAARQQLLRAVHVAPTDYKIRFNVALIMQEWAVRVYRKKRQPNDPNKLQEYRQAQAELKEALRYFEHLDAKGREVTNLDPVKLKVHANFCRDHITKADAYIKSAEDEANELAAKRETQDKMRQIAEVKRNLEELKRKNEQQRADAEKQRLAREAHDKAERLKEAWRANRGEPEAADGEGGGKKGKDKSKKRKKGDKGRDREASRSGGSEDEGGAEQREEEEADALFGSSSEEEDEKREELLAKAGLASDDEGGEGAGGEAQARKAKRRKLQRGGAAAEGGDAEAAEGGLEDGEEEGGAAGGSGRSRGAAGGDDELADDVGAAGAGLEDEEEPTAHKKRLRRAALEDSEEGGDEELQDADEAGPATGGRAAAKALDDDDEDAGAKDGADAMAVDGEKAGEEEHARRVDALFDDDEEEDA